MAKMTTKEIISLQKIKLSAEVVAMIIARAELKYIQKDVAVHRIREKLHELNAEFEKLQITTPIEEATIK